MRVGTRQGSKEYEGVSMEGKGDIIVGQLTEPGLGPI
jgi:hypothetical protein